MSGSTRRRAWCVSLAAWRVEVLDMHRAFDLRERTNDMLTVGSLAVFSPEVLAPTASRSASTTSSASTRSPVASTPLPKADSGRRLESRPQLLARGPERAAACSTGTAWSTATTGDQAVAREASTTGEFDIYKEYGGRACAPAQAGVKWDDRASEDLFETSIGQGCRFNMRLLFQDICVREALVYTYDFDTSNRLGLAARQQRIQQLGVRGAGPAVAGWLKLLEPFRRTAAGGSSAPHVAPGTGRDRAAAPESAEGARSCWRRPAGSWRPTASCEMPKVRPSNSVPEPGEPGRMTDWQANLEKLGITMKERNVDFALYRRWLEQYDFDMIAIVGGDFTLPDATGLQSVYGSGVRRREGRQQLPRRQEPRGRTPRSSASPRRRR